MRLYFGLNCYASESNCFRLTAFYLGDVKLITNVGATAV